MDSTKLESVDLSSSGRVAAFTHVVTPAYGKAIIDLEGYVAGLVDLPEHVRIQTVLLGDTVWEVGAHVTLTAIDAGTADDGERLLSFAFELSRSVV